MSSEVKLEKLDDDVRMLAAMAYGEASSKDNEKEIYSIASVIEKQRLARGFATIKDLGSKDKTFSFVTTDGNPRYAKLIKASVSEIEKNEGMKISIAAAKNAKAGGIDYSNGAYFWDGSDIEKNYKSHFKVKHGIKFTEASHNIYNISASSKLVILSKTVKKRVKGKSVIEKTEIGRYDHVYESTAAYGGTIFWKQADDYLKLTKSKIYL